jgi:amino acid adenylation domain-containing protein
MYTSGSTGVPKGIMHTHYSGLSYAKLSSELYALSPEDRIANHAPLHFDISTFGYFSAPFSCSTTIIIPDAYTKMPASLTQLIEKERITIWYSVPIAITQMLLMGAIERRDLSSLRWVLWGGEVFPTKYVRTWMEKFPQSKMSNVYGPAEVNQCTYYHLEKPPREGETVPLGVPWGNTEILVLDGNDTPVEPTEVGELLVRSATRMKGYWKQEKLTASRFYLKDLDSGLTYTYYRTGDLVKYNDDGLLEFMGRKDRQVKIRGYRVELDEIVATILQHKDVEETAVFTITNAESQLQILAHVKKHHESQLTDQELYQFIKNKIPKYALPKKIIFVNDFPRTSSGKINNIELTLNANKKVNNND